MQQIYIPHIDACPSAQKDERINICINAGSDAPCFRALHVCTCLVDRRVCVCRRRDTDALAGRVEREVEALHELLAEDDVETRAGLGAEVSNVEEDVVR